MVGNYALASFIGKQEGGNYRVTTRADLVPSIIIPGVPGSPAGLDIPGVDVPGIDLPDTYAHVSPEFLILGGSGLPTKENIFEIPRTRRSTGQERAQMQASFERSRRAYPKHMAIYKDVEDFFGGRFVGMKEVMDYIVNPRGREVDHGDYFGPISTCAGFDLEEFMS